MARSRMKPRRTTKKLDRRPAKKRHCVFCSEKVQWIDYKDADLLRRYMSERAKIRARRVTGNCRGHQAQVARAIKLARELALLPYAQRQVTVRSKRPRTTGPGSRAGGPMPEPATPPPAPRAPESEEAGEGDEATAIPERDEDAGDTAAAEISPEEEPEGMAGPSESSEPDDTAEGSAP